MQLIDLSHFQLKGGKEQNMSYLAIDSGGPKYKAVVEDLVGKAARLYVRDDVESTADGDEVFCKGYGDVGEVGLSHEGVADVVPTECADQGADEADDRSADKASASGYCQSCSAECACDDAGDEAGGCCAGGCLRELVHDQFGEREQCEEPQDREVIDEAEACSSEV
jgi:hypothetical protein